MIGSDDADYLDTKLVKQGVKNLNSIFQELSNWIYQKFGIPVLNIYYDKIDTDKDRPRLNIVFEYRHNSDKFRNHVGNYEEEKQNLIADKFREILEQKPILDNSVFNRLFKKSDQIKYNTDRLWVIFSAFEPVAICEANSKIPQAEIDKLKNELASKNVWEIYREFETATFFFYTDKEIEGCQKNGATEEMKQAYFKLLKKYDEFDYIEQSTFCLSFDSKENFDKNFESNWFWYSRR